jgi:DNA-binding transcriptional LysR family regulator
MRGRAREADALLNAGYRYFFAIAQERSIRKAADRAHISASAMSRQMSLLEEELGQALFERRARGVVLTGAGAILVEHIRRLMVQEEELRTDIAELNGLRAGHVRMALGNGFASSIANLVLPKFAARLPGMTYTLSIAASDEILRAVVEEEVDIGLMFGRPTHPSVDVVTSFAAPLAAVVAPGHRLAAKKKGVEISALQEEALALLKPNHRIRQILQRVELQDGIKLSPALESNSYEVLKTFVAHKLGVTVLPKLSVASELRGRTLAVVPLKHEAMTGTVASIIVRHGRKIPVAASEFLKALQEELDTIR